MHLSYLTLSSTELRYILFDPWVRLSEYIFSLSQSLFLVPARMKESLPIVVLTVLRLNLHLNLAAGRTRMDHSIVARHDQVKSEPRVTTHRAQPFRCVPPCLLFSAVEVCALPSLSPSHVFRTSYLTWIRPSSSVDVSPSSLMFIFQCRAGHRKRRLSELLNRHVQPSRHDPEYPSQWSRVRTGQVFSPRRHLEDRKRAMLQRPLA